MVMDLLLPVIWVWILLAFRQENKEQICSITPYMNITDAYTKALELVFSSECTRWSMYVMLDSDDGKGGL